MGRVLLGDPAGNVVEDGPPFYDFWDIHVCLSTSPPNKALQPTASRRDAHTWFYEAFQRRCHARFRQRWL